MGITDWLGMGSSIAKPIKAVGDLYTTDKARLEAEAKLEEVEQKPELARLEVANTLSASSNVFKSGYVPLAGWTAGFLLLCYYLPQIIVTNYIWAQSSLKAGYCLPFPMKPDDLLHLVYILCAGGVHSLFSATKK